MVGPLAVTLQLSGLGEVEGGGGRRTEVDSHRLGVVRVDVQAGRGQHCVEGDRTAKRFAQGATAEDLIGIQLEGGAGLLALEHVLDHPVGQGGIFVGHVDRCGARAIGETGDEATERHVLAGGLTDRGDVDLGAGDFEAPVADLAHSSKSCISNFELVGGGDGAVIGDWQNHTTSSSGHREGAGGCGVAQHVVGGAASDTRRQGAGTGAIGQGVEDAEDNRIANLEVQERLDGDDISRGIDASFTEGAGGAGGLVIQSAGRAGQNSGGHRDLPKDGQWGGHCPAYNRIATVFN